MKSKLIKHYNGDITVFIVDKHLIKLSEFPNHLCHRLFPIIGSAMTLTVKVMASLREILVLFASQTVFALLSSYVVVIHTLTNQLHRMVCIQQFVAIRLTKSLLYGIRCFIKTPGWIHLSQSNPLHVFENHFNVIFPYTPIYRNVLSDL